MRTRRIKGLAALAAGPASIDELRRANDAAAADGHGFMARVEAVTWPRYFETIGLGGLGLFALGVGLGYLLWKK